MGFASDHTDLARVAVRDAYGQDGTLTVGGESVELEGVLRVEPIEILGEYEPAVSTTRVVFDVRTVELGDLVPRSGGGSALVTDGSGIGDAASTTYEVIDTERGPKGATILVLGRPS